VLVAAADSPSMAGFALRAPVYRPWVGPARGWAAAAWFGAAVFACLAGSAPAANRPDDNDRYADRLGELVNRYREQSGGKPLALDGSLAALARQHSAAMAKAGRLSHDGFPSRFRRSGYGMCIENIGWNYLTPQAWHGSVRRVMTGISSMLVSSTWASAPCRTTSRSSAAAKRDPSANPSKMEGAPADACRRCTSVGAARRRSTTRAEGSAR